MTLNIALVGCGGMGLRHAWGYIEHRRFLGKRDGGIRVAAVCSRQRGATNYVADLIERETGERPTEHGDFAPMLAREKSLDGVDICTSTPWHHVFALQALDAGLHVMTEKPMGLTLKACRVMRDAALRHGKVLAVAENYRRDPMNRLTWALINGGAIGRPYFAVDMLMTSSRGGVLHGSVWKTKRDQAGGWVMEVGLHNFDMLIYLMGPARTVYAETSTFEPQRRLTDTWWQTVTPKLAQFYGHRVETSGPKGDTFEQDAVDTAFAVVRFASGAIGQLSITDVSHGEHVGQSSVHGSDGSIVRSPSRTGRSPVLRREGKEISGDALLELVPGFALDDVTAILWGGRSRMGSYDMEFEEIDRKIVAVEFEDFASAVRKGEQPEVGSREGMDALALAYGALEAGELGRPVSLEDVSEGRIDGYQSAIDRVFGI